jgi:hypothetical protein
MAGQLNEARSSRDSSYISYHDVLIPFLEATGCATNVIQGKSVLAANAATSLSSSLTKFSFVDATTHFHDVTTTTAYRSADNSIVKATAVDSDAELIMQNLTGNLTATLALNSGQQFAATDLAGSNVIRGGLRFFDGDSTPPDVALLANASLLIEGAVGEGSVEGFFDCGTIDLVANCTLTVGRKGNLHQVVEMTSATAGLRALVVCKKDSRISADITGASGTTGECIVYFEKGCTIADAGASIKTGNAGLTLSHGTFALKGKLSVHAELGCSKDLLEKIHKAVCDNVVDAANIIPLGEYKHYVDGTNGHTAHAIEATA